MGRLGRWNRDRSRRIGLAPLTGWGLGAVVTTAMLVPARAEASDEPARSGPKLQAIEIQTHAMAEMLPRPFVGLEGAYVVGNETFALRLGGMVTGSPAFALGMGQVANLLYAGQADICAAKVVSVHRVRMCMGGEAGTWHHLWRDVGFPGKDYTPHVAGSLKGDYQYSFTRRFGLLFGAGVTIPIVGPSFRGKDELGRPGPVMIPGPVAGQLRLGVSFRLG